MVNIYILKLHGKTNYKYYVGKTQNQHFSLEKDFQENKCKWTNKFKPLQMIKFIKNCRDSQLENYTIDMMNKYGIINVRGGSFSEVNLTDENIKKLKQQIHFSDMKCYICGECTHLGNECNTSVLPKIKLPKLPEDKSLNEQCKCFTSKFKPHRKKKCLIKKISNIDLDIDNEEDDITKLQNKERCFRCYREGHMASFCNAERHIDGFYLKNYINVEEKQKLEEERKKLEEERKYLREERLILNQERKYLTKDRKEKKEKKDTENSEFILV